MTDGPTLPAFTSAWSPATTTRPAFWLAVVPMDGPPQLEEYCEVNQVYQAIANLVDVGETGWVYLFDGVRHNVRFTDAPTLNVRGMDHRLDDTHCYKDGVLPGTELYPESAE